MTGGSAQGLAVGSHNYREEGRFVAPNWRLAEAS